MTKYKSLLLDVDGTIVPVGPHITPSTRVTDAIIGVKDALHVSLVSGRPLDWLTPLFDCLTLTAPCIINGGTQIIDPLSRAILWEQPLNAQDAERVIALARHDHVSFLVNDGGTEHRDSASSAFARPLVIQLSYLDNGAALRYMDHLQTFPDIEAHTALSWQPGTIDVHITHRDATKYHAVKKMADLLKISPVEMIGVGDGMNDIPLLRACGLKVAMGNAAPDLKAMADYIAPTVDDDGVADVIDTFIVSQRT